MKCPDVIEEWMNLYVDHALGDEEETLLMQHIDTCPECAEKFTLLKELSARLEQLPLATPSYDLVDAILPQLQAIDRAREEEASAAGIVAMPVDKTVQRRKRSRYFTTGVLGTVVAAAIFGLVIYNHELKNSQDNQLLGEPVVSIADQEEVNSGDDDNRTSPDSVLEKNEANPSITEESMRTPLGEQPQDSKTDLEGTAPTTEQKIEEKAPSKTPAVSDNKKAPTANTEKGKKDNVVKPPSRDTTTPETNNDSLKKQEQDVTDQLQDTNEFSDDTAELESFYQDEMHIGMGINSMSSQWISPDGLYSVELNDAHLYLYRLSTDEGKVLLKDQAVEGVWISGSWLEEGATFAYQTEVNGTINTYNIESKND